MATMKRPLPRLYASVLQTLLSTDPRSQSVATTVDGLAEHLPADETERLPHAIGGVLPLLRSDPERMRHAAEIAARLDFFEIAGEVAELAIAIPDRQLLLAAASLCGNPAVEAPIRARVADAVRGDPAGQIRLDEKAVPRTADEERLHWQRWPGARADHTRFALAPVVVVDGGLRADAALRFAVRLVRAGATVRRLAPESAVPFWFGPQTVLVCRPPTRSRVLSSYPGFPEDQIRVEDVPTDDRGTSKLLHAINVALPGPQKLRLAPLGPELATNIWEPEVFTAGVYQTREMAFLVGVRTATLNGLRRRGLLNPRRSGVFLWTFRDLVAVRTWAYLRSVSPGRVSSGVVPALVRFSGDSKAVKLGVTSQGRVLVDRGDDWGDVENAQGQLDLPITEVDDSFQPFSYGGGQVLDLLRASPNTRLHPTVLHGTHHLDGHRISAKALAQLHGRGGTEMIISVYPEIMDVPFDDTLSVGLRLPRAD